MRNLEFLANEIEAAVAEHAREFADGEWKAVNVKLGALRRLGFVMAPASIGMGNLEAVAHFRSVCAAQ